MPSQIADLLNASTKKLCSIKRGSFPQGKFLTHPGLLSNIQLCQQAWRWWRFSTLWSVKGLHQGGWEHRRVCALHSGFWGVWRAHRVPRRVGSVGHWVGNTWLQWKNSVSTWWVTLALDILQTPSSAAALQRKGGKQGAHKPQLHFTPEKLRATVSTWYFSLCSKNNACNLWLNFEMFIETFHSSLWKWNGRF